MDIGCCTSGLCRFMDMRDAVDLIGRAGFDFAEINTDTPIPGEQKEAISLLLGKYGMSLNLHVNLNHMLGQRRSGENSERDSSFAGVIGDIAAWPDRGLLKTLTFDAIYGHLRAGKKGFVRGFMKKIGKTSAGLLGTGYHYDFDKEATVKMLDAAYEETPVKFLNIGLENYNYGTATYQDFLNIRKGLHGGEGFGVNLDIGHLNVQMRAGMIEMPVDEYIAGFPLPVVNVHANDNNGLSDSHRCIGRGNIDYGLVLAALLKKGVPGIALEISAMTCRSLRKDLAVSREIIETSLG
ncbi:MAG: sugar phosphate isomerase/epimerase [Elusimicrobia bacterium]|nr:sugar phosphate isomerase/epimerase [Elusimicrobiota bacterium]